MITIYQHITFVNNIPKYFVIFHRDYSRFINPSLGYTTSMDDFEGRLARLEARVDNTESQLAEVEARLTTVEERVNTLDSKMDTLLDSTSQIKAILSENTKVTKSARRNTRGWGVISVILSLLAKVGEFLLWR